MESEDLISKELESWGAFFNSGFSFVSMVEFGSVRTFLIGLIVKITFTHFHTSKMLVEKLKKTLPKAIKLFPKNVDKSLENNRFVTFVTHLVCHFCHSFQVIYMPSPTTKSFINRL